MPAGLPSGGDGGKERHAVSVPPSVRRHPTARAAPPPTRSPTPARGGRRARAALPPPRPSAGPPPRPPRWWPPPPPAAAPPAPGLTKRLRGRHRSRRAHPQSTRAPWCRRPCARSGALQRAPPLTGHAARRHARAAARAAAARRGTRWPRDRQTPVHLYAAPVRARGRRRAVRRPAPTPPDAASQARP